MRRLSILIAIIFTMQVVQGGDGIEFMTGNYDVAFAKAKKEQKLMLLDFTASWCFPCKKMEREVFPNAELGEFVNDNFVSFKVNADYFWGMDIADKFKVKAYPTIIVLDKNGKIVKRITGYQTVDNLLSHLRPLGDFESLFTSD